MQFSIDQIRWMGIEVERQKAPASAVVGMARAVETLDNAARDELSFEKLHLMAAQITMGKARQGFRQTAVTFQNGGGSCNPDSIENSMEGLWTHLPTIEIQDVSFWVKQLLWIHPYEDGNGRLAAIMYNWLLGKLETPLNLPDFAW